MNTHSLILFLVLLLCSLPAKSTAQQPQPQRRFQCTANATCRSLIGYKSRNATTLADIQRFFDVKNLRNILGSNGLPESTPPTYPVAANRVIRVPVPCVCFNGSGVSNKVPVYDVQPGDGLFVIASSRFLGLVKYEQIVAVNKIADPNLIEVGQKLWIPLPCSCEDVDGERVVHYTHVVVGGSTVEEIAAEFGTTNDTLYRINGIQSDAQLIEGDPFDVPLKACNSSIRPDSEDSQLLLANGTYAFTAHNCVRCNCDASNNLTLRCQASGVKPSSDWSTCPAMQCGDNGVMLGNSTTSDCGGAICSYAGFSSNQTIFASLDSTCPASPSGTPTNGNSGGRNGSSKWWNLGLMGLVHLMLLQLCIRL